MSKYYVLFNPSSGAGKGKAKAASLNDFNLDKELEFVNVLDGSYAELLKKAGSDDGYIICGGDGTLNRFINSIDATGINNKVLLYSCGTGNDFCRDIGANTSGKPIAINKYICNLPTVTVNGKHYRFINNVGFGIDGYCTEVGDEMRAAGKDNINYAGIAIKGMLGGFKPVNATVIVDGREYTYRHVWLAPTMKGRFYGGGMMPTPAQDRLDSEGIVSVMVFHCRSKIKTLTVFPSLFQGEHIKYTNEISIFEGKDITVRFDKPCALQIDGETIKNVKEYRVQA